jgi:hypothetical protein
MWAIGVPVDILECHFECGDKELGIQLRIVASVQAGIVN